jgi:adenylate cyclase
MTQPGSTQFVKVTFVRSDGFTQLLTIGPGESVLIGRDLTCDCRLEGRKVSRRHFRMTYRPDGRLLIQDNASHNGTFVNGVRVMETILNGGEVINVGEWEGRAEVTEGVPRRRTVPGLMPAVAFSEGQSDSAPMPASPGGQELPPPPGMDAASPPPPVGGAPMPRSALVDSAAGSGFDSLTDPGSVGPTNAPSMTDPGDMSAGEGGGDTRVIDMGSVWRWEDGMGPESEPSAESMRAAPVSANPIVRRLTQSHGALDFRGLQDLKEPQQAATPGVTSNFNVDAIALQLVFKVTESLSAAPSMDAFLADMSDSLCSAARAKAVVVLLPDYETGELVPRHVKNRRQEESVHLSRTVIEWAIRKKSAVTTEDAAADERFASGESVLRFDLKAVLVVPLMRENDCIGAIYMTRDLPFTNTERDLLAALAHMIAVGLERSKLREQIASEERQRRALERFHAPDVVRRLMMEENAPVAARGNGLFLEQLTATVLFCDLSGFTRFCEGTEPHIVGDLLNSYLGNMTEMVFNHGGTVDKYIGDAIMCIFGAPFASDDDALRAVKCAIDMRKGFRKMVERGEFGRVEHPMDVHIGVNTGPVVAGTVGSSLRMEYTALGDTVNLAARLEGVANAGQIVIGPATAELVKDLIPLNSMGHVDIKGKAEQIEAFEVPDVEDEGDVEGFDALESEMTMDGDLSMIQGKLREKLDAARAAGGSSEGAPSE